MSEPAVLFFTPATTQRRYGFRLRRLIPGLWLPLAPVAEAIPARPPSPIQHPAPVCLQTQTPDSRGSGFLLARGKMRWRTEGTCLSAASCAPCSPPLAFFRKPRGTAPGIHSCLSLKAGRRVPFAKFLKLTFRHTYRYFLAINNSTANRSDNLPVFTASSDSTQNST